MSSLVEPFLAELDTKVVLVMICAFAILLALTILKRALKLAIFVGVVIAALFLVIPVAQDFQKNYHFEIENGKANIVSEGQNVTVDDLDNIKKVKFVYNGLNGVDVHITYKDTSMSFNVPSFLAESLQDYFDSYHITYEIQ
jgi:hypothetical protein